MSTQASQYKCKAAEVNYTRLHVTISDEVTEAAGPTASECDLADPVIIIGERKARGLVVAGMLPADHVR